MEGDPDGLLGRGCYCGLLVSVSDDEGSLVLVFSYAGRLMAAIAEEVPPTVSTATATPATTAASMVDFKNLARPEKFDGSDEHYLWATPLSLSLSSCTTS
eukprot:3883907-Heterocapsa_arctica.AAC.1